MTMAALHTSPIYSTRAINVRAWSRDLVRIALCLPAFVEVARQRRTLLTLDDRALKDIGISRADAHREGNRSFWDIPEDQKPRAQTDF